MNPVAVNVLWFFVGLFAGAGGGIGLMCALAMSRHGDDPAPARDGG